MNLHDPSGWLDDFRARWAGDARYPLEKYCKAQQFYLLVVSALKKGDVLLEFGAGSCVNSLLLALLCPEARVIATDLLESHLSLAHEYMARKFFLPENLSFQQLDIVKDSIPDGVSAILSDGVLEHFDREQLVLVFKKMKAVENIFISVPVNSADVEYGDERIMPSKWWEGEIKKHFNCHKKVTTYFTGHNNFAFRVARKFFPYEQVIDRKSMFKSLYSWFNRALYPIENSFAASVLYHAE